MPPVSLGSAAPQLQQPIPIRAQHLEQHDRWGSLATDAYELPRPTTPDVEGLRPRVPEAPGKLSLVSLGGSIAGLTFGIAAKLRHPDANVVCIEARDKQSRMANIGVRETTRNALASFGIPEGEIEALGANLTKFEMVRVGQGVLFAVEPPRPGIDASAPCPELDIFMKMFPVAMMRICDVEKLLYTRAVDLGVHFLSNSRADVAYHADANHCHVTLNMGGERPRSIDLGYPDLVYVADGAGGTTAASLGLHRKVRSPEKLYVSGMCDLDVGGAVRLVTDMTDESLPGGKLSMLFGNDQRKTAWFVVEIPNAESLTPEELRAEFRRGSGAVLGQDPVPEESIRWGATGFYRSKCEIMPVGTVGDNLVVGGDALGNCGGNGGLGLNLVLGPDLNAMRAFLDVLPAQGGKKVAALQDLERMTLQGREAWATARPGAISQKK